MFNSKNLLMTYDWNMQMPVRSGSWFSYQISEVNIIGQKIGFTYLKSRGVYNILQISYSLMHP